MKNRKIMRGDIYMALLDSEESSRVIKGARPVVVVSNNTANLYSPVITVVPITAQNKKPLPVHVTLSGFGLHKNSTAIVEQVLSIDESALGKKIGSLAGSEKMQELAFALKMQLDVA